MSSEQTDLFNELGIEVIGEDTNFLTQQLITYIGNKRSLLDFIGEGVDIVRNRLGKDRLSSFDVFSGSGVVARYLKRYSSRLVTNDLEGYSKVINSCYLSNIDEVPFEEISKYRNILLEQLSEDKLISGFISELYSPKDMNNILLGERCFYTTRNARYIDTSRQLIENIPQHIRKYFLAPLLSKASIHANTSGVFKGFYKNSSTNIGQFGGNNKDATLRILGDIELVEPIFSRYSSNVEVYQGDANEVVKHIEDIDLAYIDPPYNQHPYGSNYFMLNLITNYIKPEVISEVSGIPEDWSRSSFNKKAQIQSAMSELVKNLKAKFLLISFSSDGFISLDEMISLLGLFGKVEVLERKYNTFRGSRNLNNRDIHIKEYLYLLEKK